MNSLQMRCEAIKRIAMSRDEIPSWLKPNLVGYWSGQKRDNVYYPLTNLVTNGNFANGTMGWSASGINAGSVSTQVDGVVGTYAQFAANEVASGIVQPIGLTAGHIYYFTARLKTSVLRVSVRLYADGAFKAILIYTDASTFTRLSAIRTSDGTENRLLICAEASSGDRIIGATDILCHDLTAIFGAGNEPTAAEMDAILAADGTPYWDGTRNVLCNPNGKYYWYDASGNGRHMKMSNLAYAAGSNLDANGFDVDGLDDYGSIADSAATRLTGGGTLCAWIKPRTSGEISGKIIDKSVDTTGTSGYTLRYATPRTIAININGSVGLTLSSQNVITFNRWQLVAATFNATGRHIYINGVDVTASGGTETALPPDVAGSIVIGNRAGATDRTFDGLIDKPMIINRALTQAEIQQIFGITRKQYGV